MKNSSKRIFTLIILFVSVLVFSMLAVSSAVASVSQPYATADESIEIEAKYKKASTNKITFNANGGKIGSKNTVAMNIKKGAKIKKFPTTPKRTGYSFKGWFTKKTGGTKINVNTKPSKSLTYYAQWTKKTSSKVLSAEEKKLVGIWVWGQSGGSGVYSVVSGNYLRATGGGEVFSFANDRTFRQIFTRSSDTQYETERKGSWHVSGGTVYLKNQLFKNSFDGGKTYSSWAPLLTPNTSMKIQHGSDEKGKFFITYIGNYDYKYYKR